MEALVETLPLIIALIVPPIFAVAKDKIAAFIPDKWIPVVLPIGGGLVAGLATLVGVDADILATVSRDPNVWETVVTGILTGSASVGIHQIKRQTIDKP